MRKKKLKSIVLIEFGGHKLQTKCALLNSIRKQKNGLLSLSVCTHTKRVQTTNP